MSIYIPKNTSLPGLGNYYNSLKQRVKELSEKDNITRSEMEELDNLVTTFPSLNPLEYENDKRS